MKLLKVTNSGLCIFQDAFTGLYEIVNLFTGRVLKIKGVRILKYGEYLG